MQQLIAIIRKEARVLFSDIHGLLLLFVMPILFILIMSMAMKDNFDERSGVKLKMLLEDRENSEQSRQFVEELGATGFFQITQSQTSSTLSVEANRSAAEQAVRNDTYHFFVQVQPGAFTADDKKVAEVLMSPSTGVQTRQLLHSALRGAAVKVSTLKKVAELKEMFPESGGFDDLFPSAEVSNSTITLRHVFNSGDENSDENGKNSSTRTANDEERAPTSVQQNVPAWLVFSMFFVVVPLSNTLINERQLGTLRRMQTIDVPRWKLIAGKLLPFYFINQLQVVLMLAIGIVLVPAIGGDALTPGSSAGGLMLISSAVSIAALGYAMLIAAVSRTTEQATTLGGAGNIILAALGGIMVPTFVMPQFMQDIASVSPMSWGLQGFLDIFLRDGNSASVLPESLSLFAMGAISLGIALILLRRQSS